jgi:hypothetical protein
MRFLPASLATSHAHSLFDPCEFCAGAAPAAAAAAYCASPIGAASPIEARSPIEDGSQIASGYLKHPNKSIKEFKFPFFGSICNSKQVETHGD